MSINYYILSNGRVKRDQNTIFIEDAEGKKRPIPVENVDSLYLYGEVDINTKLLVFLSQKKIPLHVFNYYGFYSGSYYPREYLHSGYLLVQQVAHYQYPARRLALARELVRGSAHSLLRNIAYYERRRGKGEEKEPEGVIENPLSEPPPASFLGHLPLPGGGGEEPRLASPSERGEETPSGVPVDLAVEAAVDAAAGTELAEGEETGPWEAGVDFEAAVGPLSVLRATIESLAERVGEQGDVGAVMGVEGKMRERYYQSWRHILTGDWAFARRVRRPPDNEVNALISFGNSHLYMVCLSELYRTQLTPTISYLHEPGARRFSLALDLAEIFKPLIVDRAIFRLLNTGQIKESHFDKDLNGCFLTDAGKKIFIQQLEDRLKTTIQHRRLGRSVSYRHLIRLECYKLVRHLTGLEPYRAFRAWW